MRQSLKWSSALSILAEVLVMPALAMLGLVRARTVLTLIVVAGVLAAAILVPLPHRVVAPVVLEPAGAARVYVSVPGRLVQAVEPGAQVRSGDALARLENPELQVQIADLRGERNRQRLHIKHLQSKQATDSQAASQLPAAREALADLEQRLEQRLEDQQRLVLRAPRSGTVLPPPHRPAPPPDEAKLASWSGTPLDERNRTAWLATGTFFCLVGDPDELEAALAVDEGDVEFVRPGQRVRLSLDEAPGRVLWGTVREVGSLNMDVTPRELAADGELPSEQDASGVVRPLETRYQARVELDENPGTLLLRGGGRAGIEVAPRTLAGRVARYLGRTFRLD